MSEESVTVTGIGMVANRVNRNGVMYSKEVLEKLAEENPEHLRMDGDKMIMNIPGFVPPPMKNISVGFHIWSENRFENIRRNSRKFKAK